MAKIYLTANETFTLGSGSTGDFVGLTGGNERALFSGTATGTADANVDRVEFTGNASAYTYRITGTQVDVLSAGAVVASITNNGSQTLVFANGSAALVQTALGVATLGGAPIPGVTVVGGVTTPAVAASVSPALTATGTTTGGTTLAGKVADGYISGATVFADANGDGIWNAGETTTTTDVNGSFNLAGAIGALVASGGIDLSTGKAFYGVMKATAGSSMINPLTTLQQGFVEKGLSVAAAELKVATALGLDASKFDLTTYDPLAAALNTSSSAADRALGVQLQAQAAKIANFMIDAGNTLTGAAGGATKLDVFTADKALLGALVNAINADSDGVISFSDKTMLASIMNQSVTLSGNANLIAASTSVANMAAGFAILSAGSADSVDRAVTAGGDVDAMMVKIAQTQVVAQGAMADRMLIDAASGELTTMQTSFTGAAFDTKVTQATVGDLNPSSTTDNAATATSNAVVAAAATAAAAATTAAAADAIAATAAATAAAAAAAIAATAAAAAAAAASAPVFASATVNGNSLVMTYTEATTLDAVNKAATGTFSVLVGGVANVVTNVAVDAAAKTVTLTLTSAVAVGAVVTVGYTDPTTGNDANAIQDAAGNDAVTVLLQAVTNSTTYTLTTSAPIITEPATGTKALTFTLTLGSAPAGEVTVNYETLGTGTAGAGADFVAATGSVTFIAGQTVATVTVVVNGDVTPEIDETVKVLFSGTSLTASVTGTGTILANDTVGFTRVLTAGPDTPVLGADDDLINTDAPTQLTSADTVAAGTGYDILSITPTVNVALILDDAIFTNVSGIDKIVILDTGTGAQTITTGAEFNGAFGLAGADLQTTSTTGAMTINMSAVTGPATLTVITTDSTNLGAGNSITMGAGVTTVLATSTTGPLTINAAAAVVATVTATTSTGFVNVTTGTGADTVTVTTGNAGAGGNVIVTGAGNDTIVATAAAATTAGNTITGGLGADTIDITGNTAPDTIVIGNTDSGLTVATADRITGFSTAIDFLKMGIAGTDNVNYVEAGGAVADLAAALAAANIALNGTVLYSFQWITGVNAAGYLFEDTGVDGIADQVVVLVGIDNTGIAFGNIIA